jgi:hypothetical protein
VATASFLPLAFLAVGLIFAILWLVFVANINRQISREQKK